MRPFLLLLALALAACSSDRQPVGASVSVAEAMSGDTTGYARADAVRDFVFPADHGPHPAFKAEWWYVTGNVRATDGTDRRFGIQFTVFRSALTPDSSASARPSGWASTQLYMAHVGIGDVGAERFYDAERFARGGAGLAGATAEPVEAFLGPVRLVQASPEAGGAVPLRITGEADGAAFDLVARPIKPVVLQGDRGLSQKGAGPGNASYYYAQTRMATEGTVTLTSGETVPVEGLTWLDREWSTSALGPNQVGWDWFALHLDDGRDLMLYQLRQSDGTKDPLSEGSLVAPDGAKTRLDAGEFVLEPLATWESPAGGTYPTRWRVRVPSAGLDLQVVAAFEAQELDATIRYWEGAVDVTGTAQGVGFLEMTGYADGLEGSARPTP
ncbi:lipocalin-like domain-containing protein [Rubrivirga marina]|uniref:lipocalin-like domain-containing protein n=1 Tax=Rubrivirga marina TaxID=1196024 RepID=UPI001C530165|nr:lipocalin-like domain-containing protein [Rubrivirga marina]